MKKRIIGTAALGLAIAGLVVPTATADPNGSPAFRQLAGMGSDTTENVMQALSDVVLVGGQKVLGSYDPLPAGQIINTKAETDFAGRCNTGGGSGGVPRANGSSAGRDALQAAMTPGSPTEGCLDFARTSSGAKTADQTFVVMAKDGLTYAYPTGGAIGPNNALADLQAIYQCQVPDFAPLIPQSGSGTRNSWATLMGISNTTLPTCVKDTVNGQPLQEHDGAKLGAANQLVPFSVAQFIAQQAGTIPDTRSGAQLGSIDGVFPLVQNPSQATLRDVGNLLPNAQATNPNSVANNVFINASPNDAAGTKSLICQQGKATIEKYGFIPVGC